MKIDQDKIYKMWVKGILMISLLALSYIVVVIAIAYFTAYRPPLVESAEIHGQGVRHIQPADTLSIYTWNLGYAGLDKKSDFFYDGGRMVRPPRKRVKGNWAGIQNEISNWSDADVIFLQEVDVSSKRSWYIPMLKDLIQGQLRFPVSIFGKNYDVRFVPKPFLEPMGRVVSGILTLTHFQIDSAQRVSYPGSFSFPSSLFFLKRCFTVTRVPFEGKEVVFINTHNSAFDGGVLKKQEMAFLKDYLLKEYQSGNYVIVGGDWNQVPPRFVKNPTAQYEETSVPDDFPSKAWQWVSDSTHKSNRKVDTPFIKGVTYTTTFDFFLLSPNVKLVDINTLVRDFEYADHEPVLLRVQLGS